MRNILATLTLALFLAGCAATQDRRLDLADKHLGVATTDECRAVRAVALVDAAEAFWPDADWSLARDAAGMMGDHTGTPSFSPLSDAFAINFYIPLLDVAARAGIKAAGPAGIGTIAQVAALLDRIPQSAIAVAQVRAKVAMCEVA